MIKDKSEQLKMIRRLMLPGRDRCWQGLKGRLKNTRKRRKTR